jgi:protease PrsW
MKLRLTISSGTLAGQSYDLETGFISVGRGENCTVRFDPLGERIASKQHAFIEAKPDGFYIRDNQSTNGTLVNGVKVAEARLSHGDTVQFGKNGVTANVQIDAASGVVNSVPPTEFRNIEFQQFQQAAEQSPVNLQNSMANIGLGHVVTAPPPASSTGKYIGAAVTIMGIVFLSLIVMLLMFWSVGPIPAVVAAVVAFTPAVIYILPLLWLDRYDPEPLWLLALAFAWGALVAVIASFIINTAVGIGVALGIGGEEGMILGNIVGAVISAPVVEEATKGMGLLILLFFFRRHFDDILDGIVFGGVIALGFATVENVLYYGRAFGEAGGAGLIVLFVLRGIMSPFAHVTFTAITGIGCGIARESHNMFVKLTMPVLGYFGAVALHALWNGIAVFGGLEGFILGYIFLQIPFFIIFVTFSLLIMWRQSRILKEMLAIDVARQLIPEEHAATATSAFKSTFWLLGGLFSGKLRVRSRYLRALGSLGLSYWHIQRATAAQGQTGSFQQNPILREEVLSLRGQVD